jgi:two-component system probable response regulator PhcQ
MQRFRLLLVDDSRNVLRSLERTFRDEGYEILKASSARQALMILESETVDMIISDENMPELSGTELLRLVREKRPDIIRIMITGLTDINVAKDAINRGEIYRFFNKPWDELELLITVREAFKSRLLEKENTRLKSEVKKQQQLLKELEMQYPGITRKQVSKDGAFIIDEE